MLELGNVLFRTRTLLQSVEFGVLGFGLERPFSGSDLQCYNLQDHSARATSKCRILPSSLCKDGFARICARAIRRCSILPSVVKSLLHVLRQTKNKDVLFFWGVTILQERPAQESGLCKLFLQVEFAHAGVCQDFCKDDAARAWISIGLVEG